MLFLRQVFIEFFMMRSAIGRWIGYWGVLLALCCLAGCWRNDFSELPSQSVHLLLGNPSNATAQDAENYLMEKPQYALSYSRSKGIPNWVAWRLVASDLAPQGTSKRQNDFRPDPDLPSGWKVTYPKDYTGSGFDRGHLTNSEDRSSNPTDNSATFLMTNIIPQAPDNNRGVWVELEKYCRKLVREGKELYIIAGGRGQGGVGERGARQKLSAGQVVPATTWKVVLVTNPGQGLAGIDKNTRAFGVDMPNAQGIKDHPWRSYRKTVREIENITGYNFFSRLPVAIQEAIENRPDEH